jgi:zinc/manganese transport system substrate-binding protein
MKSFLAILATALAISAGAPGSKINIVTSTSDLKSIAEYIGGDHAIVKSINSGRDNPHFVEVLPSYMVVVSRADIYLKIGLGLDFWAQPIIDGSRNNKLLVVDCSDGVEILEKPTGKVDASMGDIHPQGNPHYWLNPSNAQVMAKNIERVLAQADPGNSPYYEASLKKFETELQSRIEKWQKAAEPLRGVEIVTYHNSWPYFCSAFGLKVAGFIEPKPGIEPTATHIAELINIIKTRGIKIIGKEPYFSDKAPKVIAAATGAKIVDLPPSVGGIEGANSYFSLIDTLLSLLTAAARSSQ